MELIDVKSYVAGDWVGAAGDPDSGARDIHSAVTGEKIAVAGNDAVDLQAMLEHARNVGGPALRAMTFHDRARALKALASQLMSHKEMLYELRSRPDLPGPIRKSISMVALAL